MLCQYITKDVVKLLRQENTKISKRALDVFNRDVCWVIRSDNHWWFQKISRYGTIPNYMRDYLIKYLKRKMGLIYDWERS